MRSGLGSGDDGGNGGHSIGKTIPIDQLGQRRAPGSGLWIPGYSFSTTNLPVVLQTPEPERHVVNLLK